MNDIISRQAAIDVVDSETISTNPEHFKSSEKFIEFMDDSDISSFGKWQWSNGFNTALVAVGIDLKKLPSVQPERTGKWLVYYECPKCGEITKNFTEYCPFCSADMRGEQND